MYVWLKLGKYLLNIAFVGVHTNKLLMSNYQLVRTPTGAVYENK